MAETTEELREIIEAQEVIIRAAGPVVQELKDELAAVRKVCNAYETLYKEDVISARGRPTQDDPRIVAARSEADALLAYLEGRPSSILRSEVGVRAKAIREALS